VGAQADDRQPHGGGRHSKEIFDLWIQYAECEGMYKEMLCDIPKCNDKCRQIVYMFVIGIGLIPVCGPAAAFAF
jgi:hypothetical protein